MPDTPPDTPTDPTTEATPLDGGCLCGAVRYRIGGAITGAGICHCLSCRRAAGAESVAWLGVAREHFLLLAGELALHHSSPGVTRSFCPRCGTSIGYAKADDAAIDVTIASLDDPERVRPTREWWLDHRLSWNPANPELEGFPEGAGPP